MDRFLIAPMSTGLQLNMPPLIKASLSILYRYTKGCFMKLRKDSIDLKGQMFGYLTALEPVKIPGKRGLFWRCSCICGNECLAYGGHLRGHERVSCGCIGKANLYREGLNRLYGRYRYKAKQRNIDFNLTLDQFERLVIADCSYCGACPTQILKQQKSDLTAVQYNGIDRKDTLGNYDLNNCVTSCKRCNMSKGIMPFEEWKSHIKKVYEQLWINS